MKCRPNRPNPMGLQPQASTIQILLLCALMMVVSWSHAAADTTVSANITTDTTWTLTGSPYIVTGYITVQGATSAGATLTIEPGVQVRFNSGRYLYIGATSGNPGSLIAQGTAGSPILFTSNQASPAPGDWYGLRFLATTNDATALLEHCTISYAGSNNNGSIYIGNAAPAIRNCVFSHGSYFDLNFASTVGGTVENCTINNGIYLQTTSTVSFSGNTVHQNNSFPIKAWANNVGSIVNGCTFADVTSDSYLEITSGNVTKDATWTAGIPYLISGSTTVQGATTAGATLTIEPGAVLKFNQGRYLNIGATSGNPGALIAQGTAESPILFTSNQATPTAGYWNQIKFDNTINDTTTVLNHCDMEYGGSGNQGMVNLSNAKPTIAYCKFRYSSAAGLYVTGSGSTGASINCNTFASNIYGLNVSGALPLIQQNNFNGNTSYGLYYTGSGTLTAENNWWGSTTGPNTTGDKTYGTVDADPWSTADHQCGGASQNYPPFAPSAPVPTDNAVRIAAEGGVTLGWGCSDPNAQDTLTYAIHLGTTSGSLQLLAQSIAAPSYTTGALLRGKTYFWKVVARDSGGLETASPVWRFTTAGDPPDLIVSSLTTSPAGGMRANTNVILIAQITNAGNGPVVDGFSTEFKANGTAIGSIASNQILAAGASMPVTRNWTYTGGNTALVVVTDSLSAVTETNEANNQLQTSLSLVADITAPALTGTLPANGAQLQQVQQISASLADTQSAINDAAVMASFTLTNGSQQTIAGTTSESNDTFTFIPSSLPLADGVYLASIIAADTYGNTQNYSFNFTIDTQPPAKPTITGGTVASGTIQARPAQNVADRVIAQLEGTCEENNSVWVNGTSKAPIGPGPWSFSIEVRPGENSFEIFCQDRAGNPSVSEWVDIRLEGQGGVSYEYDTAGRLRRTRALQ